MQKNKADFKNTFKLLNEASSISVSLVFFPIIFLLSGVILDSKLDTGPAFTLVGIVLGVVVGFIRAIKIAGKVLTKK
ncbi:MAG: hypothetical protein ACD_52C00024G0011 [uncultured bacterium]|nr:MAG: hypothetical protein ACD_52C00024G0011 [uncultured bacterium]